MQKTPIYQQSLESRKRKCRMIMSRFPDKIPVIILRGNDELPEIKNKSFLVTDSSTFSKLLITVINELRLSSEEDNINTSSITLLINNRIAPSSSMTLREIHNIYKSEDGFLYMTYIKENTFG